jgi:UDPglucose 6-dehydrogenase
MVGVDFADSSLEALEGADAAVIVTEWPEFAALDWSTVAEQMAGSLVVDGRNCVDPARVTEAGLLYEGVGRSAAR